VVDGVVRQGSMNVACVPMSAAITMPGPRLRQVLVTTDFSTLADRAIAWAFALAGREGTVHLVHIAPANCQDVTTLLQKLRDRVPQWAGAEVAPQVIRSDHVGIAICQAAERLGVDVMCMARHGRTGLAGLLLGSVAQQVVQEARRPLLLVPPP
jgi:nucleotide-binding universal stress UspA family protein